MKIIISAILALASINAFAFPKAPHNALTYSNTDKSLRSIMAAGYDFEGIIKLSNCSGSLIAFNGQPLSSKAIVMTNGHCIEKRGGYLNPGEVWSNRANSRAMKIFDSKMKLTSVQATKILYATMTDTDVAFYELSESYSEIYSRTNVRPFLLDSDRPFAGTRIDIISGYWDRGYSCEIDTMIYKVREGAWTWTDSIKYTPGCDTIGGTSGSPIIARGERRVIGVNNTTNEEGKLCTLNNPCEVNEAGETNVRKGNRYGQQTFNIYSCLTPSYQIDLSKRGCNLPK